MYVYRYRVFIELRLRVSRSLRSLANNSRVRGYPEAKPRENRKRGSYAERLTHALAIVYLTYTT